MKSPKLKLKTIQLPQTDAEVKAEWDRRERIATLKIFLFFCGVWFASAYVVANN